MDIFNCQERSLTPNFNNVFEDEDWINFLPNEILIRIFSFLPIQTLVELPFVCRKWSKLQKNDEIWVKVAVRNHFDFKRFFIYRLSNEDTAREVISLMYRSRSGPVFDPWSFLDVNREERSIKVQVEMEQCRLSSAIRDLFRCSSSILPKMVVWSKVPDNNGYRLHIYIKEDDGILVEEEFLELFPVNWDLTEQRKRELFAQSQYTENPEIYEQFQLIPHQKNLLWVDVENLTICFNGTFSWEMIPNVCDAFKKNKEISNGSFTYFYSITARGIKYALIFKNHAGDVKRLIFKLNIHVGQSELGLNLLHLMKTNDEFLEIIRGQQIDPEEIRVMLSQSDSLGEEELDTPFMYQRFESIF